ncbi:MAG: PorV/PorQ family protein [Candidatus Goldiibacteriota bacterium]
MKKRFIIIIAVIILSGGTVFSDVGQIGTTSNNFLKILSPSKPAAMGGSYYSLASDIHSIEYNPAGISKYMISQVSFTHIQWIQDIMFENINLLQPFSFGNMAFSLNWMHFSSPMEKTETDLLSPDGYTSLYSFDPYAFALTAVYAVEFTEKTHAGVSMKLLNYAVNPDDDAGSAMSVMIDAGLLYDIDFLPGFSAGIVFRNLGPGTSYINETYLQPMNIAGGIGYKGDIFGAEASIEYYSDNDINFAAGGYVTLFDLMDLRAGFKGGTDRAGTGPAFGAGFLFDSFAFDYAFVPFGDDLGYTHRATLSYGFGSPKTDLKARPAVFSPNNDGFMDYTFLFPEIPSIDMAESLVVKIYDEFDNAIRGFKIPPTTKRIYWDGKNSMRRVVRDGDYYARVNIVYDNGIKSESNKAKVTVDNTPPRLAVDARPKKVKPGRHDTLVVPITFTLAAKDLHGIGRWKFVITGRDGKVFKTFSGSGTPYRLVWDGKDDSRRREVQTGQLYGYTFYCSDRVGNRSKTRTKYVNILKREIVITLSADTLFDPGKADVKISVYKDLKEISDRIKSYDKIKVRVEGHTDNVPMRGGIYADNLELSQARAEAVVNFFVRLFGLDRDIFTAVGKGASEPVASNDTPEGRLQNRRVSIHFNAVEWE